MVGIMAEGCIPGSIVSWIASASLAALKKLDGSHHQVVVARGGSKSKDDAS